METKNIENQVINSKMSEKANAKRFAKIGKLESKEMLQVTNEKTLLKHLSTTRQKIVNLSHVDDFDTTALLTKHVNFCEKHRNSALVGFDAKAIKDIAKNVDLTQFVDERGFNAVNAMSYCIGILDKQRKELMKKQAKATEKATKQQSK